ncbi:MAG: M23 family metallopeptidase [bacterium]|jgi:murein DD-endopeptidase MepM/ murein hydrolase activator NlpD
MINTFRGFRVFGSDVNCLILVILFVLICPDFTVYATTPFNQVVMPTDRKTLDPAVPGNFQPTAAGTVESALYGSVRTVQIGKHLYPSFHEGIDIAPLQRNGRGVPLDEVHAVAAGTVGYINQKSGNSNYGNYVVLLHQDPIGAVYTLYAHLAAISPDLRVGQAVEPGRLLGMMGNTSSGAIPLSRAHLHFEVGLIVNEHFGIWFRAQKLKPDHGLFNGGNLIALNPLTFFNHLDTISVAGFKGLISEVPRAFTLMIQVNHPLDYFRRYPGLWAGTPFQSGGVVMTCSENGAILSGRNATPDEIRVASSPKVTILGVDAKALGRNGCRLIVEDRGRWRLGEKGTRWLDILEYQ